MAVTTKNQRAVIDFGSTPTNLATAKVLYQGAVRLGMQIEVWVAEEETPEHTLDEVILDPPSVWARRIDPDDAGGAFFIYASSPTPRTGRYIVNYIWVADDAKTFAGKTRFARDNGNAIAKVANVNALDNLFDFGVGEVTSTLVMWVQLRNGITTFAADATDFFIIAAAGDPRLQIRRSGSNIYFSIDEASETATVAADTLDPNYRGPLVSEHILIVVRFDTAADSQFSVVSGGVARHTLATGLFNIPTIFGPCDEMNWRDVALSFRNCAIFRRLLTDNEILGIYHQTPKCDYSLEGQPVVAEGDHNVRYRGESSGGPSNWWSGDFDEQADVDADIVATDIGSGTGHGLSNLISGPDGFFVLTREV